MISYIKKNSTMPQVFQVLRCYKCLAFQVHQVKKSNKWECKLCGEKQSMKRHYGIGTGSECRLHVQKLNKMRGETEQNISYECSDDDFEANGNIITKNYSGPITSKNESKWSNYVQEIDEPAAHSKEECETLFGEEVVLEIPKKRKKVFNKNRSHKNKAHKDGQLEDIYSGDDVTNESYYESNNTTSAYKKQIQRFIPPTIKTQTNWTKYESENINNPTDDIPHLNLFNKDPESKTFVGACIRNNSSSNITVHTAHDSDMKKHNNFHNAPGSEALKITSKWSDFIDNECSIEPTECDSTEKSGHTPNTNQTNFFSLCDDNDLDSILNI